MLIFPTLVVLSFNTIIFLGLWNFGNKPSIGYQLLMGILIAVFTSSTVATIAGSVVQVLQLVADKPAELAEPATLTQPTQETITCESFRTMTGTIIRCIDADNRNICYFRDNNVSCVQLYETSDTGC